MSYQEKMYHYRSAFRQCGFNESWVTELRDEAIRVLHPVIAKVPRDMSTSIKARYAAKGISTEWNLATTDAYSFYFMARDAAMTSSQQSAASLLYACTEALEENALSDRVRQNILDALAGLDSDAVATGNKFRAGRKLNTGSIIRKKIASLLKKNHAMKNPELWAAVAAKPPRGWTAYDNRVGKYLEGTKADDSMGYARFCTVCGEERKKIKQ